MNERNVIRNVKMFSKPDLVNERETRKKKKRKKKLFHKLFKKFHSIIHEHSFNERVFSHTRTYETNCTQVRSNIVNSEETNDPRRNFPSFRSTEKKQRRDRRLFKFQRDDRGDGEEPTFEPNNTLLPL